MNKNISIINHKPAALYGTGANFIIGIKFKNSVSRIASHAGDMSAGISPDFNALLSGRLAKK